MNRRAWVAGVLTLSFALMAGTAMAAKGIITNKPGTANPKGRIVVTDGGADPVSSIDPGSAIGFAERTTANVGDLVSFEVGADADGGTTASHLAVEIPGTVYSSPVAGNLSVGANQVVLINGAASFDGKISVNGGYLVITDGASIGGRVEGVSGSGIIIESSRVGSIEVTGALFLSVKDSTVEGKLSSRGGKFTSVTNCTIKGKLEILNASKCKCSGNTVDGKTNTPGCTA